MTPCRYIAVLGATAAEDGGRIEAAMATADRCLGGRARHLRTGRVSMAYTGHAVLCQQPQRSSLILGDAFAGPGTNRIGDLPDEQHDRIWGRAGPGVVDHLWGRFVAFLDDERLSSPVVVREPSAGQPCYHLTHGGLIFVASDVELLTECSERTLSVDTTEVAGHLLFNQLRRARTCLSGVDELLGGHRLRIESGAAKVEQIWSPWTFGSRAEKIEDEAEASARLRATIEGCVRSLASPFDSIVLSLSGGLDSSIVLACLASSRPKLTCLTMATDEANGDERFFARSAAHAAGVPVVEMFESLDWVDLDRCDARHLPRPIGRAFNQSIDHANREIADQVGADAYFGGAGGDNVFCFLQSAAPIADCLLDGRWGEAWRTARNIGILAGASTPTALRKGIARAWFRSPAYRWRADLSFLTPALVDVAPLLRRHPWLEAPRHAYPGKAGHIASIMNIQNHLEGFAREQDRPVIAPLMAQPIMELCLRIPSWMWCRDGRDRAVARAAFRGRVPDTILDRRSKGTPESFVARLFERHRAKMAEMLLEGELAREGFLDRSAIATALRSNDPVQGATFVRIMKILDVEMWLRAQRSRPSAINGQKQPALP